MNKKTLGYFSKTFASSSAWTKGTYQVIAGQMIRGNSSNLCKIASARPLPSYKVGEISQHPAYFLQSNRDRFWNEVTGRMDSS